MPSPSLPSHCPQITLWQSTALPPSLQNGELHLWKLDDPDRPPPAADLQLLSPSERERAQGMGNPAIRDSYIHNRRAMRLLFGGYLGIEPGAVQYAQGPHGKPYIDLLGTMLQFNLTHCGRLSLLAVTRGLAVGLDAEKVRERRGMEAIAERMFDPQQLRHLGSLPERQRLHQFYHYWTTMEAVVKARGGGLFDGHSRELAPLPHTCFTPHPGFQACLAVDGPCPPISEWKTLLYP